MMRLIYYYFEIYYFEILQYLMDILWNRQNMFQNMLLFPAFDPTFSKSTLNFENFKDGVFQTLSKYVLGLRLVNI